MAEHTEGNAPPGPGDGRSAEQAARLPSSRSGDPDRCEPAALVGLRGAFILRANAPRMGARSTINEMLPAYSCGQCRCPAMSARAAGIFSCGVVQYRARVLR